MEAPPRADPAASAAAGARLRAGAAGGGGAGVAASAAGADACGRCWRRCRRGRWRGSSGSSGLVGGGPERVVDGDDSVLEAVLVVVGLAVGLDGDRGCRRPRTRRRGCGSRGWCPGRTRRRHRGRGCALTRPRAKPCGSSGETSAMGSPVLVETSASHSACCSGGTTRPAKTARIQVSTSRAVAMAPPAACAQEMLSPRTSRPMMRLVPALGAVGRLVVGAGGVLEVAVRHPRDDLGRIGAGVVEGRVEAHRARGSARERDRHRARPPPWRRSCRRGCSWCWSSDSPSVTGRSSRRWDRRARPGPRR